MLPFSYTLSDPLKAALDKADALRTHILITPLAPKEELRIQWETTIDRIYYGLILEQNAAQKRLILETLSSAPQVKKTKQLTPLEKTILEYKKGIDYLANEWLVTTNPITIKTVTSLHNIACPGKYRKSDRELEQIMTYLGTTPDHPIIQAAVAYACLLRINAFTEGNYRIASLISLLFLYKSGYDCRGLLNFEKEWLNHREIFQEKLEQGMNSAYMTGWIEYFAEMLVINLKSKLDQIREPRIASEKEKTFFQLNHRQKAVLTMFREPGIQLTNRDIQKQFKISQITASRDLSHLVLLGLLVPHGKGRSVSYTKLSTS